MQIIYVKLISMNYENIYGYLCFCCADAVDCGAAPPRCMGGLDGVGCLRPVAPLDCGSSPQ